MLSNRSVSDSFSHLGCKLLQETGEPHQTVSPQISRRHQHYFSRRLPAHVKFVNSSLFFWIWTFIKDVFILTRSKEMRKVASAVPRLWQHHKNNYANETLLFLQNFFLPRWNVLARVESLRRARVERGPGCGCCSNTYRDRINNCY